MRITAKPEGERESVAPNQIILRRLSQTVRPWHGMTETEFRIHKQEQIANLRIWAALRENEANQ